jgi:hypothetical protein
VSNIEITGKGGYYPYSDFPIITDTFIIISLNCDNSVNPFRTR